MGTGGGVLLTSSLEQSPRLAAPCMSGVMVDPGAAIIESCSGP